MNRHTPGQRTTLASLEKDCRRLAAPGAPRAGARASTLGLGRDVLAQIDLLRGKRGARERGLFALVPSARPGTEQPPLTDARAYDLGAPVRVSRPRLRALATAFGSADGPWLSLSAADEDGATLAFAVESFDDVAVPPAEPATPPAAVSSAPAALPLPSGTPAPPIEVPVATALARGVGEDGLLGLGLTNAARTDWAEDADQFEREIQDIIAGRTARPARAASAPSSESPVPEPPPASLPRPHDIFEQMGQNMAYATAFTMPPMELRQRFDRIEQEIARDELGELAHPSTESSLALSDEDIAQSLGWAGTPPARPVNAPALPAPVARVGPRPDAGAPFPAAPAPPAVPEPVPPPVASAPGTPALLPPADPAVSTAGPDKVSAPTVAEPAPAPLLPTVAPDTSPASTGSAPS